MKISKNDFWAAVHRLGPHACMEFVLNTNDDIYAYLNEVAELDKISNSKVHEFEVPDYYITIAVKKMSSTAVYVMIHKKPEGFLGFY